MTYTSVRATMIPFQNCFALSSEAWRISHTDYTNCNLDEPSIAEIEGWYLLALFLFFLALAYVAIALEAQPPALRADDGPHDFLPLYEDAHANQHPEH